MHKRSCRKKLLLDIQQYVQGSYLYIPVCQENKKRWGESSGYKQMLHERNKEIFQKYSSGMSAKQLAEHYYMTEHSIRRIIRGQRGQY